MDSIQLALYHFEQHNSDEALKVIDDILLTAKDKEKYHVAYLLFDFGFIENAQEIMEELLGNKPNKSMYKSLLADIYIELQEDEKAIQLLHDILPADDEYLPSLLQLADLYQSQGLDEVAEEKLKEAKQRMPKEEIISLALAELYFFNGEFNKCIPLYTELSIDNKEIGGILIADRLAEGYAAIGKYEEALEYFKQIEVDEIDILFKHGLTAFYLERYQLAIQQWKKLLELDPYYYTVYYYLGKAYYAENLFKEAEEIINEGLAFDEHNDEQFYLAAKIANKQKQTKDAIRYIEEAIQLNPDHREYTIFYITLLREHYREDEVILHLQKALKNDLFDPIFEWELAKSYYELDEFERAVKGYNEAYKYFEEDAIFLHEYGYILIEAGKVKEGKDILKQYLNFEPTDEDTIEFLSRL